MSDNINKILLDSPTGQNWSKIGVLHHHGIDLPLSALHSKNSCGIGEFYDLIPIIDWCKEVKLDVIQLLPLNDSGSDPSPYNSVSSCSLNPVYLTLQMLPFLDELPDLKKRISELQALTKSQRIAYWEVKIQKLYWLRLYFLQVGARISKEKEFEQFLKENPWVISYGLFKVIKDMLEQSIWQYWPEDLKYLSQKRYDELVSQYWDEICFHVTLQYFSFAQLKVVKKHASDAGVFLKGDIPILISGDSVDVWHNPEFFDLTYAAGAPPDFYSKEQQYWGFPLYRWDVKKKTQYSWWKQRLGVAAQFFDLYRLDHVVGLFRIWAIPAGQPQVHGRYLPEDESLWIPHGKEILEMMISSFRMLPVAEDLGNVPTAVRHCLEQLGVPGTKVMRWERYWNEDRRFIAFDQYPPISMTCISTHDSETLAQWWKYNPDEGRDFASFKGWQYNPDLSREQRKELLWDSHHTASLFHINLLQEYLALFPDMVWGSIDDERINVPGKTLPFNWTYRFRPSVEEIVAHTGLKQELHDILLGPSAAQKTA